MLDSLNRNILILFAIAVCQHMHGDCSAASSITTTVSPNNTSSGFSEASVSFSGFSSTSLKETHNFTTTTKTTTTNLPDRSTNSQTKLARKNTTVQQTKQESAQWLPPNSTTISTNVETRENLKDHTTTITYDDRSTDAETRGNPKDTTTTITYDDRSTDAETRGNPKDNTTSITYDDRTRVTTPNQQTSSTTVSPLQIKDTIEVVTQISSILNRETTHKVVPSSCDNCSNISKANISGLSSWLPSPTLFTNLSTPLQSNTERNISSTNSIQVTSTTESYFNNERNISQLTNLLSDIPIVSTAIRLPGSYSDINTRYTETTEEITFINSTPIVLSAQITTLNKLPQSANLASIISSATTISNTIKSSLYSEMQNLTELAETSSVSMNIEESTTIFPSSAYLISTSSYGMADTTSDSILPTKQSSYSLTGTATSQVSAHLYFNSSSDSRSEILKTSPVSEYYSSTTQQGYDSAEIQTSTDFFTEEVTSSSFYSISSSFHGDFESSLAVSSSSYADVSTVSPVMPPTTPDGTYYVELDNLRNRVNDLKSSSDGYRIATFALAGALLIVLIILIIVLCRKRSKTEKERKQRSKSKNRFTGIDDDFRKPVIHRPKPTFAYGRDSAEESLRFSGRISTATLDEGDEMAALGTFTSKTSSYNNNMHSESLDT